MAKRLFWLKKIEEHLDQRNILWLAGVRRVGKTFICKSIPDVEYFDCELPRTRRRLEDPESFLEDVKGKKIVLDEIHRLGNPSEILKIAADHYPTTKIIATGSSTLGASAKFKDTLTGRKTNLWLTPICLNDLPDFKKIEIKHRLLYGGLPPFFLESSIPHNDFQEWMDSYWAKDIQELFRLERKHSFEKFTELMLVQSGGIFEANKFAKPCEVSRTTISNYLKVLDATFVAHIIRPFSSRKQTEIISAPKVYGFDTGFVCYYKGWHELRNDDLGILWEHFVLNEIHTNEQMRNVFYWRDKRGHEVDFILIDRKKEPIAIECKWSSKNFDPKSLLAFRRQYPAGTNIVVAHDVDKPFTQKIAEIKIRFTSLEDLNVE